MNGPRRRSEADLRRHLENGNNDATRLEDKVKDKSEQEAKPTAEAEKPASAATSTDDPQDFQLTYALDLMRGITLMGERAKN